MHWEVFGFDFHILNGKIDDQAINNECFLTTQPLGEAFANCPNGKGIVETVIQIFNRCANKIAPSMLSASYGQLRMLGVIYSKKIMDPNKKYGPGEEFLRSKDRVFEICELILTSDR